MTSGVTRWPASWTPPVSRRKGRKRRTTRADTSTDRDPDLVCRTFRADASNLLWVGDLTYVAACSGCFACAYFTSGL
jgi:putative transposase